MTGEQLHGILMGLRESEKTDTVIYGGVEYRYIQDGDNSRFIVGGMAGTFYEQTSMTPAPVRPEVFLQPEVSVVKSKKPKNPKPVAEDETEDDPQKETDDGSDSRIEDRAGQDS